ncbi:hypothetical protein J5N97_011468 [Dioscorea zingiberensis]|uniref:R13L1/DRL21-like LRR repeat region domain-containing protein n=1 Tax=Dioscorea zingiberensis TaxID=325984 RepID=A0A9D5D344_9LILI|nr:hypothetical protein J5N97_011468 [Dioscorea zingiberensis]
MDEREGEIVQSASVNDDRTEKAMDDLEDLLKQVSSPDLMKQAMSLGIMGDLCQLRRSLIFILTSRRFAFTDPDFVMIIDECQNMLRNVFFLDEPSQQQEEEGQPRQPRRHKMLRFMSSINPARSRCISRPYFRRMVNRAAKSYDKLWRNFVTSRPELNFVDWNQWEDPVRFSGNNFKQYLEDAKLDFIVRWLLTGSYSTQVITIYSPEAEPGGNIAPLMTELTRDWRVQSYFLWQELIRVSELMSPLFILPYGGTRSLLVLEDDVPYNLDEESWNSLLQQCLKNLKYGSRVLVTTTNRIRAEKIAWWVYYRQEVLEFDVNAHLFPDWAGQRWLHLYCSLMIIPHDHTDHNLCEEDLFDLFSAMGFLIIPSQLFYIEEESIRNEYLERLKHMLGDFQKSTRDRDSMRSHQGCYALSNMPSDMGIMYNLVILSNYIVSEGTVFLEPRNISDLRELDNLHGTLHIENLNIVKEPKHARDALLKYKLYLRSLVLQWNLEDMEEDATERSDVQISPAPPPPNVAAPSPPQPTPHEVPPPKDQPPKQKTKKHKATQGKPINSKAPPWRTQLEADGMEHLFISVGLNKGILNGRERMKTFSIITVKERKAGSVTIQDITDVLACLVDEHWTWTVKPLRDGRYIVAFPTAELARQTEKAGPLSVLAFDLSFEPWSPDLWQSGKAEGATRWVIIRNLPMDCWGRDEAASLLKPAGDLVAMDRRSQRFGNDLRLLLRVRWPRRLPASIHCSMGVRQFNYTVELDAGQPALPWEGGHQCPVPANMVGDGAQVTTTAEDNRGEDVVMVATSNNPIELSPERRPDKGKAPMMEKEKAPKQGPHRRPTGIIIQERPPSRSHEHLISSNSAIPMDLRQSTASTGAEAHHSPLSSDKLPEVYRHVDAPLIRTPPNTRAANGRMYG